MARALPIAGLPTTVSASGAGVVHAPVQELV
jgi:hypothetical protein